MSMPDPQRIGHTGSRNRATQRPRSRHKVMANGTTGLLSRAHLAVKSRKRLAGRPPEQRTWSPEIQELHALRYSCRDQVAQNISAPRFRVNVIEKGRDCDPARRSGAMELPNDGARGRHPADQCAAP